VKLRARILSVQILSGLSLVRESFQILPRKFAKIYLEQEREDFRFYIFFLVYDIYI